MLKHTYRMFLPWSRGSRSSGNSILQQNPMKYHCGYVEASSLYIADSFVILLCTCIFSHNWAGENGLSPTILLITLAAVWGIFLFLKKKKSEVSFGPQTQISLGIRHMGASSSWPRESRADCQFWQLVCWVKTSLEICWPGGFPDSWFHMSQILPLSRPLDFWLSLLVALLDYCTLWIPDPTLIFFFTLFTTDDWVGPSGTGSLETCPPPEPYLQLYNGGKHNYHSLDERWDKNKINSRNKGTVVQKYCS